MELPGNASSSIPPSRSDPALFCLNPVHRFADFLAMLADFSARLADFLARLADFLASLADFSAMLADFPANLCTGLFTYKLHYF